MAIELYCKDRLTDLIAHLAARLRQPVDAAALLAPVTILTPNPQLRRWLQLELARRNGVAINVQCQYLEEGLWGMLAELDDRTPPARRLDPAAMQLLLQALWQPGAPDADAPELAPVRAYLGGGDPARPCPDYARRSWQLAGRLATFLREYEYHRQDLVHAWEADQPWGEAAAADTWREMEACQRWLYRRLFARGGVLAPPPGAAAATPRSLTLPRYARDVLGRLARGELAWPATPRLVVLFELAQVSPFHLELVYHLAAGHHLVLYQLSVCGVFVEDLEVGAGRRRPAGAAAAADPDAPAEHPLLQLWGRLARDKAKLLSELENRSLADRDCACDWPQPSPPPTTPAPSVLQAVQLALRHRLAEPPGGRLPQDCSVQIFGCPSRHRELEAIRQSILYNLAQDPTLKFTDIAVLVSNMAKYQPLLEAVFDRPPRLVPWNLSGGSAASDSVYSQAVGALLELAQGAFTRREVFALLLNPCFLTARGLDRDEVLGWAAWAEQLAVYHCFDAADKARRGYGADPAYTWEQALQRLRLGRIMEPPPPDDAAGRHFRELVPYADLESENAGQLSAFCLAVEQLHRRLGPWREATWPAARWATELAAATDTLLAVPADRAEEETVRRQCRAALQRLAWVGDSGAPDAMTLPMVAAYVESQLAGVGSRRGSFLTGGINIGALAAHRPLPFRVIYVAGLGEGEFAGPVEENCLDLRRVRERLGDLQAPDEARHAFLETLMAAGDKLYLSYVSQDLQRHQEFHPGAVVQQLIHYLDTHVLTDGPFRLEHLPLGGHSEGYLRVPPASRAWQDVRVNYSPTDRLLCLVGLSQRADALTDEQAARQLAARQAEIAAAVGERVAPLPAAVAPSAPAAVTPAAAPVSVGLRDLARYLENPALAAMQRHLRLWADDEEDSSQDEDEPFYSDRLQQAVISKAALEAALATPAVAGSRLHDAVGAALTAVYAGQQRRGRTPVGAFADVDRDRLQALLAARVAGGDKVRETLADFVAARARQEFWARVSLGESGQTAAGSLAFPPLLLDLPAFPAGGAAAARVTGSLEFIWRDPATAGVDVLLLRDVGEVRAAALHRHLFPPFLFCLAALANERRGDSGTSAAAWVGRRFTLHLAHRSGITAWSCVATPAEARTYLAALVADCLRPGEFDLLPWELVGHRDVGRPPWEGSAPAAPDEQAAYAARLADVIVSARDSFMPVYRAPPLIELAAPAVPADAYAKARRRFAPFFGLGFDPNHLGAP